MNGGTNQGTLVVVLQVGDRSLVIYDRGCLRAGEEWIESNLVPVAGVAVGVAVLQVGRQTHVDGCWSGYMLIL